MRSLDRPGWLVLVLVLASQLACGGDEPAASPSPTSTSSGTGAAGAGAGSAGGGGNSGTGGASAGGGGGGVAPCSLTDVDPIVVTQDGQIIENVRIVSTSEAAITVDGHAGVVIRNVAIEHAGGPGIDIAGSDDVTITNVSIEHTGAPDSGANPSDSLVNVACFGSAHLSITNARLSRGSSGVYLVECPDSSLHFLEGHDFRGPFPRGQLVQWDKSNGGVLEDFSVENPSSTSWPEDNVNAYQSVDIQVRRGLVDGNNSPSGVGVIFDGDLALGVVEDVDAVRMGNGCFSDFAGSDGVVFRRTRCRENICADQGRGAPLSGALMWAGHPGYTEIRLEDSAWFDACNPQNLVWPQDSFAVVELVESDFALRAPIAVDLCWE